MNEPTSRIDVSYRKRFRSSHSGIGVLGSSQRRVDYETTDVALKELRTGLIRAIGHHDAVISSALWRWKWKGQLLSAARVSEYVSAVARDVAQGAVDLVDRFLNGLSIPTGPGDLDMVILWPVTRLVAEQD